MEKEQLNKTGLGAARFCPAIIEHLTPEQLRAAADAADADGAELIYEAWEQMTIIADDLRAAADRKESQAGGGTLLPDRQGVEAERW